MSVITTSSSPGLMDGVVCSIPSRGGIDAYVPVFAVGAFVDTGASSIGSGGAMVNGVEVLGRLAEFDEGLG